MQRMDDRSLVAAEKPELLVLPTPDVNAETPAHLLDDDITPTHRLFVRNTGAMPGFSDAELAEWTLTVDGFVREPRRFTLDELKSRFEPFTQRAVMECAGNGRGLFEQPTSTVMWKRGAVGCAQWSGVRLRDVLMACGVAPEAVYTAHHSPDRSLDGSGAAISRGLPIAKALAPETMLAFGLNGAPLPPLHGGPIRIVAPGFPGAASQKWLTRIDLRDREHDGERMCGTNYRMPRVQLKPGDPIDESLFDVITDMPVRSVVTSPRDGFTARLGDPLMLRGHAWSGHVPVAKVEVSTDGGQRWREAALGPLPDRFAWRRVLLTLPAPQPGRLEILMRATDAEGRAQPLGSAPWNPRGYLNNMCHRISGVVV